MLIDQEMLQQAVNDVCAGMLGLSMEPSDQRCCDDEDAVSAVIQISGGWDSLIQVIAPRKTAVAIAKVMFELTECELSESDIHDAFGEIVNMVGGNLKGIVQGESSLSLPCVGEPHRESPFGDTFDGLSVAHLCQGDSLIVRVLDRGVATGG